MKRIFILVTCIGALFLSACSGESNFPTPTGKGSFHTLNAIPDSPEVAFLIEERLVGAVMYKQSSGPEIYDDLEYLFNFEIRYPGETTNTRVASQPYKVEKDRDHIFVLTGDINAPTIIGWDGDIREFNSAETVYEARFSHASLSLDDVDIDVYVDEPGTVLGTNPPVATLSYGEIGDATDFEQGTYVITVTTAGDLDTVQFISFETGLLPRFAHVFTVLDGDGNDTAPITIRSMTSVGNPLRLTDARYPPETRFIHTAYTLETVDVYNDELLTNLIAADVQFQAATPDLETSLVGMIYYFTPADSQATILFDMIATAQNPGTHNHIYLTGPTDGWGGTRLIPDRAASSISVRLRVFSGVLPYPRFDVYVKNRGEPLTEDDRPIFPATYRFYSPIGELNAGSYDIHLTEIGTKTEIAAPYPIDVSLGDIVDLIAVDTIDPAIIQLVDVPVP
jgi:hypothetical protein